MLYKVQKLTKVEESLFAINWADGEIGENTLCLCWDEKIAAHIHALLEKYPLPKEGTYAGRPKQKAKRETTHIQKRDP